MLINLRNALMAGRRLPYDAEVEYLESSGTQWIDTGTLPDFDMIARITLSYQQDSCFPAWGTRGTSYNNRAYTSAYDTNAISTSTFYGGQFDNVTARNITNIKPAVGQIFDFTLSKDGGWLNGIKVNGWQSNPQPFTPYGTIYLFGRNDPAGTKSACRIYHFSLELNGTLLQDLIPVRKGTVGYLYDRVSGALFGNAGTGDFVLGPDVVPVEWLETSGSQYIDTGVTCGSADTTVFEFDQSYSALQSGRYIWGSNYGANQGKDADNYYVCGLNRSDVIMQTGVVYHCKTQIAPNNAIKAYINGTLFRDNTGSSPYTNPFYIFRLGGSNAGEGRPSHLRIHHLTVSVNNARVRSFHSIRVGTGSTWEGAMMDVLTRRIYRNAGSGAFTYGNDLKYPIPAS